MWSKKEGGTDHWEGGVTPLPKAGQAVMECNFTFDGKHCLRDFDCIYVFNKSRPVSPDSHFHTFEVSGASGTLMYGDARTHDVLTHKGALYLMHTPGSDAAALRMYRQIGAWLKVGRRRLTWDYEPDRYLLAEIAAGTDYTETGWPDGGLEIAMRCQPLAYDLQEAMVSGTLTDTAACALMLPLYTGEPAPVCCDITNTGAAVMTGVSVAVGDKQVTFTGLTLAAGQTLRVDMEAPIGATVGSANALPKATRFDYLTASGPATVTVTPTFGSGTKQATVRVHARGRWI